MWVRALLCKLQQRVHSTRSRKVYRLLAHGQWFSPGTPASSTTKTGRHDLTEILLIVTLNTKDQNQSNHYTSRQCSDNYSDTRLYISFLVTAKLSLNVNYNSYEWDIFV